MMGNYDVTFFGFVNVISAHPRRYEIIVHLTASDVNEKKILEWIVFWIAL